MVREVGAEGTAEGDLTMKTHLIDVFLLAPDRYFITIYILLSSNREGNHDLRELCPDFLHVLSLGTNQDPIGKEV